MTYDLVVVGGGINGAGIARDAAGRGLSVLLVEKGDLGGATSSASSKLIHGGLRYLEHYEFRLVREALQEREVLLRRRRTSSGRSASCCRRSPGGRSGWMLRAGLFLYDHLGGRKTLPGSQRSICTAIRAGPPLRRELTQRLRLLGLPRRRCAARRAQRAGRGAAGAAIAHAHALSRATRGDGVWRIALDRGAASASVVRARALVNAAGPWVAGVRGDIGARRAAAQVRLVKGSHIVVPRINGADHAYLCRAPTAASSSPSPTRSDFTLIGTTDVAYDGDPGSCGDQRRGEDYLCSLVARSSSRSPPARAGHRVELCRRAAALRRRRRPTPRR